MNTLHIAPGGKQDCEVDFSAFLGDRVIGTVQVSADLELTVSETHSGQVVTVKVAVSASAQPGARYRAAIEMTSSDGDLLIVESVSVWAI